MELTITHTFVSGVANTGEGGLLGPDEWNDVHVINTGMLVFDTANNSITANTYYGQSIADTPVSVNWTGTEALDPANGDIQDITMTGAVTTLTDNMADGESIILQIDDGTAYAITWPTITWVSGSGTAPTLQTTGDTIITIWKNNTTLFGFAANGA